MKLRKYATRVQQQNGKEKRGKKRMLSIQKNDNWKRGQTYRNWWWKIHGTRDTQRKTTRSRKRRGNTFYISTRSICLLSLFFLFLFLFFLCPFLLSSKQNIIFCYTEKKTAGKNTDYYIHSTRTQTTAGHGPTIVWLVRMAGRTGPPTAGTSLFLGVYMHSYTHLYALVHDYRIILYRNVQDVQTLPYDLICCSSHHIIITVAVTSTFAWLFLIGVADGLDDWIYIDSKLVELIGHAWTACKTLPRKTRQLEAVDDRLQSQRRVTLWDFLSVCPRLVVMPYIQKT